MVGCAAVRGSPEDSRAILRAGPPLARGPSRHGREIAIFRGGLGCSTRAGTTRSWWGQAPRGSPPPSCWAGQGGASWSSTAESRGTPPRPASTTSSRVMAPPQNELLRIGREQLGPYPGVEVREARAIRSAGSDGDFEVALGDGSVVETRKILLATGVHDELPERPGFRDSGAAGSTTAPTATAGRSATGRWRCWRRPKPWRCGLP